MCCGSFVVLSQRFSVVHLEDQVGERLDDERVVHNEELRTSGCVHFANFSRKQSGISMGPFG